MDAPQTDAPVSMENTTANATAEKSSGDTTPDIVVIIQCVVAGVGIISNATVITVFANHKKFRRKIPNKYIINQVSSAPIILSLWRVQSLCGSSGGSWVWPEGPTDAGLTPRGGGHFKFHCLGGDNSGPPKGAVFGISSGSLIPKQNLHKSALPWGSFRLDFCRLGSHPDQDQAQVPIRWNMTLLMCGFATTIARQTRLI